MNTREKTRKLVLSALFLALCLVLPLVTGRHPHHRQYAAAHALSRFSLCISLRMAICAVFRLSAAHLPQHDFRMPHMFPLSHCHWPFELGQPMDFMHGLDLW